MKMLKVLHISGARGWGGNEQQLIDLIYESNLKKTENTVLGIDDSSLSKICHQNQIKFLATPAKKLNTLKNFMFLKRIVLEHHPTVIHLHTSDSLTFFVLTDLLYGLKVPTVFSKKGMGRSSSILSKFKYNYKNLTSIICVSQKVKDEFSEQLNPVQKRKLTVIYDGISLPRISKAEDSAFTKLNTSPSKYNLLHIGNHVAAKSLPTLIEMMHVLVNQLGERELKLIQIGEFKEKITLQLNEMILQYGLTNHVLLAGFIPNASSYIHQFDLFVMSSEREGLPLTIYEAFFKMTPVVSTKAGGIPEIISDGQNGYLIDIGDFNLLAKKVSALMKDEEMKKTFKQNAFTTFTENFTAEQCAKKTIELYKKISQ